MQFSPARHEPAALARTSESYKRQGRRKIGMIFQNFNLFPHMTALQNVTEAPRNALRLSRSEADERTMELLDVVDLSDKRQHYPSQLSGGQQQRVAIARPRDTAASDVV